MSVVATAHATDEDLLALGIPKRGDLICLRRFCMEKTQKSESKERLREKKGLPEKVLERSKSKKTFEASSGLPHKKSRGKAPGGSGTKKVQIGWLHYSDKQKRYISVRQNKGDGTRDVHVSPTATADIIIETGKELFFPDGVSTFGKTEFMEFALANYREDIVSDVVVGGASLPFTLQRYMNATKLPKARLYLASKKKQYEYEQDDQCLLQPVIDLTTVSEPKHEEDRPVEDAYEKKDAHLLHQPMTNLKATGDLIARQDKEYQESLLADQHKAKQRKEQLLSEICQAEEQEHLRQARLCRVPDEPKGGSGAVLIQVRHLTLGTIRRNFCATDKMMSVYDWVGSISLIPMYFELSDYSGQILKPEQSVMDGDKSTLNMSESESTPSLEDDDIGFKGFGTAQENNDDTLPLNVLPPVESSPPE